MASLNLRAEPLTREAFAPYGDVIETEGADHFSINSGAVERFHDLAQVDVGVAEQGRTLISIARCNEPSTLPYRVPYVERHPLGSQAFIPVDSNPLILVVAPAGEQVVAGDLRAFVSNGRQGINYHRGTWHIPLISERKGQEFLVVDRGGPGDNCEERYFPGDEIVVAL